MALREIPFLPEDDCIQEYENAVAQVALRRVIRRLFSTTRSISIQEILNDTNISLNSLANSFNYLNEKSYIEYNQEGLLLNHAGRCWAIQERKKIFMSQIVVNYKKSPEIASIKNRDTQKIIGNVLLPEEYCFPNIDKHHCQK